MYFAFLRGDAPALGVGNFAWRLIQTNIKANHIGYNGFGSAIENIVGVVVDLNNYRLVFSRYLLYLNQVAGENAHFEKRFA